VFSHRAAITHPDLPLAGGQASLAAAPIPDDELLTAELARLDRDRRRRHQRRRLIDLWGGFIELPKCSAAPLKSPPAKRAARQANQFAHGQPRCP
jgi:hypothetical protein